MTPYGKIFKILFRKFSPPHRSTLLCWNVINFSEIVRYLPDRRKKIRSLSNCRYWAGRAQNLPGSTPTFGSHCSRFLHIGSLSAEL